MLLTYSVITLLCIKCDPNYVLSSDHELNPVLTKVPVQSLHDIKPGNHIMTMTKDRSPQHFLLNKFGIDCSQHFLVDSVDIDCSRIVAYTCESKKAKKDPIKWKKQQMFRIDYDRDTTDLYSADDAIKNAQKECKQGTEWLGSDEFVTMMKLGQKYSFASSCLLEPGNQQISCTRITPNISIEEGDAIVVKTAKGFQHVIVLEYIYGKTFITTPDVEGYNLRGQLKVTENTVAYRINYKQQLPVTEVLKRAHSKRGQKMLRCRPHHFMSWVKTGHKEVVNMKKLRKTTQIAQITPWECEKILSVGQIQVGDHLILAQAAHWFEFMVTECYPVEPSNFRIIYSLHGCVREEERCLDLNQDDIYRVRYCETFDTETALKRARSDLTQYESHDTLSKVVKFLDPNTYIDGCSSFLNACTSKMESIRHEVVEILKAATWAAALSQLTTGLSKALKSTVQFFKEKVLELPLCSKMKAFSTLKANLCEAMSVKSGSTMSTVLKCFIEALHSVNLTEIPEKVKKAIEEAKSFPLTNLPWGQMEFVTRAKTGSEDGVEVDCLRFTSIPLTKSGISTFAQLNPGDYLVEKRNGYCEICHHYLVTEVKSPSVCTVTECWNFKIQKSDIELSTASSYYRINYDERGCLHSEQAIERAQELVDKRFLRRHTRQRFVNYVKTGDSKKVTVDELQDDRTFQIQKQPVRSALELKPGDHIECTVSGECAGASSMIVVSPVNNRRCKVRYWNTESISCEDELDLFQNGDVWQVQYPERLGSQHILDYLTIGSNFKKVRAVDSLIIW